MKKFKILSLFLIACSMSNANDEGTVLVPLGNGKYERVAEEEILPKEIQDRAEEIELEIEEEEREINQPILLVEENNMDMSNSSILEDLLKVTFDYNYKKIKERDFKKNKNAVQNEVVTDFIRNSKMTSKVTEDLYLMNLDIFTNKTKFEDIKDLNNNGFVFGLQYGINNNNNIRLNTGYSQSKYSGKTDNLYLSLDYNYFEEGDYNWEIGAKIGYLNGNNEYYKTRDMFIGILYGNVFIPLAETVKLEGNYETTILSNKIGLALRKDIYYFETIDINVGIASNYVFDQNSKEKKIYTHLEEKEPSVKIEAKIKGIEENGLTVKTYYDFIHESVGANIEYKF